jgi:hypothetical protein
MEGEVTIHPEALNRTYKERADEYTTLKQIRRLGRNIRNENITLPQVEDGKTVRKEITWKGYLDIMDTAKEPTYEFEGDTPVMTLTFDNPKEANTFSSLVQDVLRGSPVKFLPGETVTEVRLENYGHEDQCTLGRVGTALLLKDYGEGKFVDDTNKLEENARFIVHHSIDEIVNVPNLEDGTTFDQLLPEDIRNRLHNQKNADSLGEKAGETMLTSGIGISLMGREVRQKYKEKEMPLRMQRNRKERPKIESRTDFYQRQGRDVNGRPVSGITATQKVRGDAVGQLEEKICPVRDGDIAGIVKQGVDVLRGDVIGDVLTAGARAVQTVVEAPVGAVASKAADRWTKREQQGVRREVKPVISYRRRVSAKAA